MCRLITLTSTQSFSMFIEGQVLFLYVAIKKLQKNLTKQKTCKSIWQVTKSTENHFKQYYSTNNNLKRN